VMIRGRRPGEGPYAASITLLKARATEERVPLLIEDLHILAERLADPLRAVQPAGRDASDDGSSSR
jgi:hypothetical protein